jgi:hypothetical protein
MEIATDNERVMHRTFAFILASVVSALVLTGCGEMRAERPPADQTSARHFIVLKRPAEGIIETSLPFPSAVYLLDGERVWQRWHAGKLTTIYAGALTRERSQGVVIVLARPYPLKLSLDPRTVDLAAPDGARSAAYRTPLRSGFVRIVGQRGTAIVLTTRRGRTWTFDLASHKFHLLR